MTKLWVGLPAWSRKVLVALATFISFYIFFGAQGAVIVMATIGWHEYCHLLTSRYLKVGDNGFYFVPLMGGISIIHGCKTLFHQSLVALGGPIGGGIVALLTTLIFIITGNQFLWALSLFMVCINLFNLAPIPSLDGGHILSAIFYSISEKVNIVYKVIGLLCGIAFFAYISPIMLIYIMAVAGIDTYMEFMAFIHKKNGEEWKIPDQYLFRPAKLTLKQGLITGGTWLMSICTLLAVSLWLWDFHYPIRKLLLGL